MNGAPSLSDRLIEIERAGEGASESWAALRTLAASMEADGRSRDDPMREVMGLLGDRWTMLILLALGAGDWRHATLRRIIGTLAIEGAISQRMLTLKLRSLERDGIVARDVSGDVPPQVTYRLDTLGRELLDQAQQMLDWIRRSCVAIERHRWRFDARSAD